MFSDDELTSIIRYIDMYHNNTSPFIRNRAIKFLTSKFVQKFPTITEEKILQIINDFNPELYKDIEAKEEYKIPVASSHSRMMDKSFRPSTWRSVYDRNWKSTYDNKHPSYTDRSWRDYHEDTTYDRVNENKRIIPKLNLDKIRENDFISRSQKLFDDIEKYRRSTQLLKAPDWMNSKEVEYFNKSTDDIKKILIESYDNLSDNTDVNNKPIRLKVLTSSIPNEIKYEIFNRLNNTPLSGLGESPKYMSWVNSLLSVPFGVYTSIPCCGTKNTKEICDYINDCEKLFDEKVYGHKNIKNEFLTMLGSWIIAGGTHEHGNVIGITGPVGVGKTTLIKEGLCRALNRPFYFISLGGTSYASLLQGHGYTYEGSTYGEIVRGVIESGCMDPIFYFDELDKVSSGDKGEEIIHSLIHLTDPAQNSEYHDRYFAGVDIDVSRALFVFSYNNHETVNPILRDRIYEIVLDDFTTDEKVDIATQYILPKISNDMNLSLENLIVFDDDSVKYLVELCENNTGMRTLKNVFIRMLRILNLADISDGNIILNIDSELLNSKPPYLITKDILKYLYDFCKRDVNITVSNKMMYI